VTLILCTSGIERGRDRLLGETLRAVATVVTANLNHRGTAESFDIVILTARAVLLTAFWTDLQNEFSRFLVAIAAVMNQSGRIMMLSMFLLTKGKTSLNTNQWTILALKEAEILVVRVHRKHKCQRKFVIPVVSLVLLPQLRE
jgi:hypothetical protein